MRFWNSIGNYLGKEGCQRLKRAMVLMLTTIVLINAIAPPAAAGGGMASPGNIEFNGGAPTESSGKPEKNNIFDVIANALGFKKDDSSKKSLGKAATTPIIDDWKFVPVTPVELPEYYDIYLPNEVYQFTDRFGVVHLRAYGYFILDEEENESDGEPAWYEVTESGENIKYGELVATKSEFTKLAPYKYDVPSEYTVELLKTLFKDYDDPLFEVMFEEEYVDYREINKDYPYDDFEVKRFKIRDNVPEIVKKALEDVGKYPYKPGDSFYFAYARIENEDPSAPATPSQMQKFLTGKDEDGYRWYQFFKEGSASDFDAKDFFDTVSSIIEKLSLDVEPKAFKDVTSKVKWNDNTANDPNNLKPRTQIDEYDGLEVHFVIKDENGDIVGEPDNVLDSEKGTYALLGLDSFEGFKWSVVNNNEWGSNINLPTKLGVTVVKDKKIENVEYTVEYKVIDKESYSVEGYITEEVEKKEGVFEKFYTAMTKWSADVQWLDNGNVYDTRPDVPKDHYKLFRYRSGVSVTTATEIDISSVDFYKDTDKDTWKLSLKELPGYDTDGTPFVYYIMQLPTNGKDPELCKNGEAGHYKSTISNDGLFAADTSKLYNSGTITNVIENTTTFTVNKVWEDDHNLYRPNYRLWLYRIVDENIEPYEAKMEYVKNAIKYANPVQGNDYKDVPKEKDSNEFTIVFPDAAKKELPMYDNTGKKYIYFALEVLTGGDESAYIKKIVNLTPSPADKHELEIKNIFDTILRDPKQPSSDINTAKYVLNNGTIKNDRERITNTSAIKDFKANSLQSVTGTVVRMQLLKCVGTNWVAATKDDIAVAESDYGKYDLNVSPDGVTVDIKGFTSEAMKQESKIIPVHEYDTSTGAQNSFRWVETAIKVDNSYGESAWLTVDYDINNGNITYDEVKESFPHVTGPGVGTDKTTVRFKPEFVNSNTVKNTLVADTQVKVTKKWKNESGELTKEQVKELNLEATFVIKRNDKKSSDPDSEQGETQLKYSNGNDVNNIVLNNTNYSESEACFTGIWKELPRYDENGNEYIYTVEEKITAEGWHQSWNYSTAVVPDEHGDRVTQKTASFVNAKGGSGINILVEKQWLDDSDLLSRKDVVVKIYEINTGKEAGSATLKSGNSWTDIVYINTSGHPDWATTADGYVALEESVGGVKVTYPNFSQSNFYSELHNKAKAGISAYSEDNRVGYIENKDTRIIYDYNVYCEYVSSASYPKYLITNQRKGVENIEIIKTWVNGELNECLDTEFQICIKGSEAPILLKSPIEIKQEKGEKAVISTDKKSIILKGTKDSSGKFESDVIVINLPKYDEKGSLILYDAVETKMDGENFDGNAVTVKSGDRYTKSVTDITATIKGDAEHHTGDTYTWKLKNVRQETYDLVAYKVWRDDGTALNEFARPDIAFDLCRVSLKPEVDTTGTIIETKDDLKTAVMSRNTSVISTEVKRLYKAGYAETVEKDKFWNTEHNDWFWSCDLKSVDRYDSEGYPFVYFIREIFTGSQGNYKVKYFNGGSDAVPKTPTGDSYTTKEVFDYSIDDPAFVADEEGFLVVADGVNKGPDDTYGNYYSRVTVNYREDTRTIKGRKLWNLPDGWKLPNELLPEVDITLYRFTEPIKDAKGIVVEYTQKQLEAHISSHSAEAFEIGKRTIDGGDNYNFTFPEAGDKGIDKMEGKLPRYDEFGRSYYYYVMEEPVLGYSKDEVRLSTTDYVLKNTYSIHAPYVKISFSKVWKSLVAGLDPDKSAKFELRAYHVDADGNKIKTPNTDTLMSTVIINENMGSFTFEYYAKSSDENTISVPEKSKLMRLPYYGVNGHPLHYYIVETTSVNGYSYEPASKRIDVNTSAGEESVVDGDRFYSTNAGSFTNTYTGKGSEQLDFIITKNWVDNGTEVDNTDYRPSSITVDVWRQWDGAEIAGKVFPEGNVLYGTFELTAPTSDPKNSTWTLTLSDLDKYAPNGKPYTYYVKENSEKAGGDVDSENFATNTWKLEKYEGSYEGTPKNTVKNTLKDTTSVTVNKKWYTSEDGTGTTKEMEWATFCMLRSMGALPESIEFIVQRKAASDMVWQEVPALPKQGISSENNVLGVKLVVANITQESMNGFTKSWDKLPVYINVSGKEEYSYRVIEKLNWKDGTIKTVVSSTEKDTPLSPKSTKYLDVQAKVNVSASNNTFEFDNIIPITKVVVKKNWDDKLNSDDTRPDNISITFKADNGASGTITMKVSGSTTPWTSEEIVLPMPLTNELNKSFVIEESVNGKESANYEIATQTTKKSDAGGFTFELTNKLEEGFRRYTDVSAKKIFADDTAFYEYTRPTVKFVLCYLKQDKTVAESTNADWVELRENSSTMTAEQLAIIKQQLGITEDTVKTVSITGDEGTVKWEHIGKYWQNRDVDNSPKEIHYGVKEILCKSDGTELTSSSYVTDFGDSADYNGILSCVSGGTVTFTNRLKTVKPKFTKSWYRGTYLMDKEELERLIESSDIPESITWTVLKKEPGDTDFKGTTIKETFNVIELESLRLEGNTKEWTTGLPAYNAKGEMIEYTLAETGYTYKNGNTLSVSPAIEDSCNEKDASDLVFNVSNAYTDISVTVIKNWDDNEDQDGIRPEKITLNLYRDDVLYSSEDVEADASGKWEKTFSNIPKYNVDGSGKLSVWTVDEKPIKNAKGIVIYKPTLEGKYAFDSDGKVTITNQHDTEKVSITVNKTWNDSYNQDGKRPTSVTFEVYDKDAPSTVIRTVDVTGTGDVWSATVEKLDKYKNNGELIKYAVREIISTELDKVYTPKNDDDLTITNTHTPETMKVKVVKIWDDDNNNDGKRPTNLDIKLFKQKGSGEKQEVPADSYTVITSEDPDNVNKWIYEIDGLPKYEEGTALVYSVEEVILPEWGEFYVPSEWSVSEEPDVTEILIRTLTVTNTHTNIETSITVNKNWDDNHNQDGKRPTKVVFDVYDEDDLTKIVKSVDVEGTGDNWSATVDKLKKYKDNGKVINYVVSERMSEDFAKYYTAENNDELTITNTHDLEKMKVEVSKIWEDNENSDKLRPESVEFELLDGTTVVDTKEVTAADGWKCTFEGLDRYRAGAQIVYTVREKVSGSGVAAGYEAPVYEYSESGADTIGKYVLKAAVTNKHEQELTSVKVKKVWEDEKNRDGIRPDKLTFRLYRVDSESPYEVSLAEVKEVTVPTGESFEITFDGLKKYKAGTEGAEPVPYKYFVTEDTIEAVEGKGAYLAYGGKEPEDDGTLLIRNEHAPATVKVQGSKFWKDSSYSKRPDKIVVRLFADGVEVDSKVVTMTDASKPDEWSFTFDGATLYAFRDGGKEIVYTVTEDPVEGYTTEINKSDASGDKSLVYEVVNKRKTGGGGGGGGGDPTPKPKPVPDPPVVPPTDPPVVPEFDVPPGSEVIVPIPNGPTIIIVPGEPVTIPGETRPVIKIPNITVRTPNGTYTGPGTLTRIEENGIPMYVLGLDDQIPLWGLPMCGDDSFSFIWWTAIAGAMALIYVDRKRRNVLK